MSRVKLGLSNDVVAFDHQSHYHAIRAAFNHGPRPFTITHYFCGDGVVVDFDIQEMEWLAATLPELIKEAKACLSMSTNVKNAGE